MQQNSWKLLFLSVSHFLKLNFKIINIENLFVFAKNFTSFAGRLNVRLLLSNEQKQLRDVNLTLRRILLSICLKILYAVQ